MLLNRLLAKDAFEFKALQQTHKEKLEEMDRENELAIKNQEILNKNIRIPIS